MKKIFLLLIVAVSFLSNVLFAQISVTATAGTPGPTIYSTLKGGFDAINAGTHQGSIIISVNGNTTELTSAVLNSTGAGSASYSNVLIKPTVAATISGPSPAGRGLIELNGADNVTIDGAIAVGGSTRDLTVTNIALETVEITMVIRIAVAIAGVTTANNNIIKNLLVNGSAINRNIVTATSTSGSENRTYGIFAGGGASTTITTTAPSAVTNNSTSVGGVSKMNGLIISNNEVNAAGRGIAVLSSSISVIDNLTVTDNLIGAATAGSATTVYTYGMTLQGFTAATISRNTIRNIESFVERSCTGIDLGSIENTGRGAIVENNIISGVLSKSTSGTGFGAYGICVDLMINSNSTFRNNFIKGISKNISGNNGFSIYDNINGIRIHGGSNYKFYHNTIHLSGTLAGSITAQLTSCFTITSAAVTGVDVRNNIFSNVLTGGTASSAHVSIYLPSGATSAMNLTINNNAYYSGTSVANHGIAHGGTTYSATVTTAGTGLYKAANFNAASTTPVTNLRNYTATLSAAGTNDNASYASEAAAPFISATNLHLNIASSQLINVEQKGELAVGVTSDIDNDVRPNATTTLPDMGADEVVACAGIFTTVANGDWSNPATWACGIIPPTNTTAATIAHQVTVSTAGNVAGNVTVNAGATLTVSAGELTQGASSTGSSTGNSNKLLVVNGTLTVTGGTLNINGGLRFTTTGYAFNMSGGTVNIDGNDGTAAGSITTNGLIYYGATGTNNVTGGNVNLLDPAYSATATDAYAVGYNVTTTNASWGVGNTLTLGGGDDVNFSNIYGYHIDSKIGTGTLILGTVIMADGNFSAKRHFQTGNNTANITVLKNLTVNAGAELNQTSADAVLVVTGNLVNNGLMTFEKITADAGLMFAGDAQYSSEIIFTAATSAQSLSGTGFFRKSTADAIPTAQTGNYLNSISFYHLKTSPGVTMQMPVTVGQLGLRGGKVNTTSANFLSLGSGTSLTGVTTAFTATSGTLTGAGGTVYTTPSTFSGGHVVGPLNRWFTGITVGQQGLMPVGSDTSKPAQILFTAPPNTSGYITATWVPAAGISTITPALNEPAVTPYNTIDVVLNSFWKIQNLGTLTGGVYSSTFTLNSASNVVNVDYTTLLKRIDGGTAINWIIQGTHGVSTGSNTYPTVTRSGFTTFSEFSIGGTNLYVLPVSIQYLRGSKKAGSNYLDWKVSCTSQPSVQLILERSADGRSFTAIYSQNATAARCLQGFNFIDNKPLAGYNYYRLKTTSPDGTIKYSTIVVLLNTEKGFEFISLAPNPVKNTAVLSLASVKGGKIEINISDFAGKVISTLSVIVTAGNNPININCASLGAGKYIITAINEDGEVKTMRFVKF